MATPITSKRFLELCDKWGIKYTPIKSNWATHNRNHKGEFSNVNGVMVHHTGKFSSVAGMCDLLWNGYAALPGPLCHSGIDPAGILRLAGWGRTNHAGLGSKSVLDLIQNGLKGFTHNIAPGPASVDGNAHFYGFEIMCDGKTPMTDAQRIASVRITAALCTEHGWGPDVIAHGEWQQGKWDPGANGKLISMTAFRNEVEQAIKEGPRPKLPPRPKPTTQTITVVKGDTLSAIAKKYGVTLEKLINDNPAILQVGDKLTVPKK